MSVFTNFANSLRDGMLTREELQERKAATEFCNTAKVVCVAAAIVVATVAVFSILSGSFAGVLFGVATGAIGLTLVHDGYCLFDNIQKVYDDAVTELFSRIDKEGMKTQLTRGMIIARPIMESWIDSIQTRQR